jgi:hypothetical protein
MLVFVQRVRKKWEGAGCCGPMWIEDENGTRGRNLRGIWEKLKKVLTFVSFIMLSRTED